MKETERIKKLFEEIYDGNPWIEVTLDGTLKVISASEAAEKRLPNGNSIWEIVNHIISWRLHILQRMRGSINRAPEDNFFVPKSDVSEPAWYAMLQKLSDSQSAWISFLNLLSDQDLAKVYPENNLSCYEHIHGLIQHDAYHLGQIVLLSKHV